MRPGPLALVSALSAVIGAALVIAVASAFDWLGTSGTQTVISLPDETGPSAPAAEVPLGGESFDAAGLYESRADGVVTVFAVFRTSGTGQGSGFVVSDEGYVLTSAHVIATVGPDVPPSAADEADEIYVGFRDGDRVAASLVGWDIFSDVAVLKVDPEAHALAPVPLGDSSEVQVGEPVAAIGSPFGEENSLAVGVVSATGRTIGALTTRYSLVDAIQIDAPLNRGNSGGPLFDAAGDAIGINAQIRSDTGLAEGVGFAVPINAAKRSMQELIESGRVSYAYLGVLTEEVWPALAEHLELDVDHGTIIAEVVPGGPAARAGLRGGTRTTLFQGQRVAVGGDVVTAVNDRPIERGDDLVRIITNDLRPGERATFTVLRRGRRLEVPVLLGTRPTDPDAG